MTERHKALIIGAGNIGALYDTPASDDILTHAHAYTDSDAYQLVGFVDECPVSVAKAAAIWGGYAYTDIGKAIDEQQPDIISVCVPDASHASVLKKIISLYRPQLVFTEKPIAESVKEGLELDRLYNEMKVPLLVNYSRRFVPKIIELADEISAGQYGHFICGRGVYGKGLRHNGSHMIDLLHQFIGRVASAEIVTSLTDAYDQDPSISAMLEFKPGGRLFLDAVDCRIVAVFELELIFEKARLRLNRSCGEIEICPVSEDTLYKGYRIFQEPQIESAQLTHALPNALLNIKDHLDLGRPLRCPASCAVNVLEDCERIIKRQHNVHENQ